MRTSGALWCWGDNEEGKLGDGTTTSRLSPVRVGSSTSWVEVSTGWDHTCARRSSGTLWCWGDNDEGELGDSTTTERHSPKRVESSTLWTGLSVGDGFTVALNG